MVHCNQCGYEWEPRGGIPVACTRCKRYDWKAEKKERRYGRSKDVDTGAAGSDAAGNSERGVRSAECQG